MLRGLSAFCDLFCPVRRVLPGTLWMVVFLGVQPLLAQTIRYVKPGAAGDGSSWSSASGDLQTMIDAAGVQQVWVAGGVYKPGGARNTDRSASFSMKNEVAIYGGFVGNEMSLTARPISNLTTPSSTTLSGDIGLEDQADDNSYHIINNPSGLTASAVLDGFVLTRGNANGLYQTDTGGGGVFNKGDNGGSCSPTFRNCLFLNNSGGAMQNSGYFGGNSSPSLTNCSFVNNVADRGGALFNDGYQGTSSPTLTNCFFQGNSLVQNPNNDLITPDGGAILNFGSFGTSSPTLINCSFQDNMAVNNGGAIISYGFEGTSNPILVNCSFQNNTAKKGGAMYNDGANGTSSPTLTNCSFGGNSAVYFGGAIYNSGTRGGKNNPILTNCSFGGNRASNQGGAMYNEGNNNGSSQIRLANCVLWGNGDTKTFGNDMAEVSASYSLFDNTTTGYTATNSLTVTSSPFAGTATTQPSPGSPGIDAGDNQTYSSANGPSTDLAGNPRLVNTTIDMGAYEFQELPCRFIVYVTPEGSGNQNGTSWGNALPGPALQLAINTAARCGSQVRVATGSYKPTTTTGRQQSLVIPSGVQVYGGYTAGTDTRTSFPSSSTLSGDIGKVGDTSDNSFHVVRMTSVSGQTRLDGFVITGGQADNDIGGGLYNLGQGTASNPTLIDLHFIANSALNGGGVYSSNGSPNLTNCSFIANSASQAGGGLYNSSNSRPTLINCSFVGNSAQQGGGIAVGGNSAGSRLINCTLSANVASSQGGAIYDGTLNNTTQFLNCILWNNGGTNTFKASYNSAAFALQYSLVDATATSYSDGSNNLTTTTSPFAGTATTQLIAGSPAINSGSNVAYTTANGPAIDLAGSPRIQGGTIDMGAYELAPNLTPILYARPSTVYATRPITVVVDVVELTGVSSSGPITVRITKDALISLSFSSTATALGEGTSAVSVQNSYWTQQPDAGGYYVFSATHSIPAGDKISLGLSGLLTSGSSTGNLTVSATLEGGSGGEVKVNNNIDAEKIDYFQQ